MAGHCDVQSPVGYCGGALLLQLDLLHTAHAAAHLHERHPGLQHSAGGCNDHHTRDSHLYARQKCWVNHIRSKDYFQLFVGNDSSFEVGCHNKISAPFLHLLPQNGLLSALPYLGCSVTAVLSGQLADYLRESCNYTTAGVRKAFTIVGEASTPSARAAKNNYFLLLANLLIIF